MHHGHVTLHPQQFRLSVPEDGGSHVHGHEGRRGEQEVVQPHHLPVLGQRVGVPRDEPRYAKHRANTRPIKQSTKYLIITS